MVTVKRYGNRRLYDTRSSSYVTLADVAATIKGGDEVRVVDATTGDDLTPQMLTQIIFEDRSAARLLPSPLLHQLIRMGDDALAEFFGRYLSWALDMYLQARQGLAALPFNPFAAARYPIAPFPAPPPAPSSDELAALRRELDELRRELRKSRR